MILTRFLTFSILLTMGAIVHARELGIVGKYHEDGLPVVVKFVNELPAREVRERYGWLTVISWEYDGSRRNGMPGEETNQRMIELEDTIDTSLVDRGLCRHAYSRTGNNLKELVYYISDRDEFMDRFNASLAGRPSYPIDIRFYEDRDWSDFEKLRERFESAQ